LYDVSVEMDMKNSTRKIIYVMWTQKKKYTRTSRVKHI
jgi:hypothetical protein